jgi:hypothetical protein
MILALVLFGYLLMRSQYESTHEQVTVMQTTVCTQVPCDVPVMRVNFAPPYKYVFTVTSQYDLRTYKLREVFWADWKGLEGGMGLGVWESTTDVTSAEDTTP